MTAENMRHAIMNTVKANNIPVTGDFWFMLVFRTDKELRKMCQEMHIATK